MSQFTPDQKLAEWLGYHPADTDRKRAAHEIVRTQYYLLAVQMNDLLPEGPDKTVALRALRDAAMQANAALACGGGPNENIIELIGVLTWPNWLKAWADYSKGLALGVHRNPVV